MHLKNVDFFIKVTISPFQTFSEKSLFLLVAILIFTLNLVKIYFIYKTQNNYFASKGFTICTAYNTL